MVAKSNFSIYNIYFVFPSGYEQNNKFTERLERIIRVREV